jgi:hypothetical protein
MREAWSDDAEDCERIFPPQGKTTMPFFSQGNFFACLILRSLQFRSDCELQTCCDLQDIHCIELALIVQIIHFADGWGNSRLN